MSIRIRFVAEVGLRVKDLPRMVAFYEEELGFEVELAKPTHVFMKAADLPSALGEAGHGLILGLFLRPTEPDSSVSTLDHLAFEIPSEDYDAAFAKFDARGLVLRTREWPETLDWRGKSFFIRDPEGNVIELICALSTAK